MRNLVIALFSALVLVLGVSSSQAAPSKLPTNPAAHADGLLVYVHGPRHRECRPGPIRRWNTRARHRHIGREVQICGRRHRGRGRPANWRNRGCFEIGPVWYCP